MSGMRAHAAPPPFVKGTCLGCGNLLGNLRSFAEWYPELGPEVEGIWHLHCFRKKKARIQERIARRKRMASERREIG